MIDSIIISFIKMKVNFWPKSTKYDRPFSVLNIVNKILFFLIKYKVFGKSMKKYLLTCENYFGRTYSISFIFWKKNFLVRISIYF